MVGQYVRAPGARAIRHREDRDLILRDTGRQFRSRAFVVHPAHPIRLRMIDRIALMPDPLARALAGCRKNFSSASTTPPRLEAPEPPRARMIFWRHRQMVILSRPSALPIRDTNGDGRRTCRRPPGVSGPAYGCGNGCAVDVERFFFTMDNASAGRRSASSPNACSCRDCNAGRRQRPPGASRSRRSPASERRASAAPSTTPSTVACQAPERRAEPPERFGVHGSPLHPNAARKPCAHHSDIRTNQNYTFSY